MDRFYQLLKNSKFCTVFTGAGISTLSGIPDFRSPNGVYSKKFQGMDVEEILSIDCFLRSPGLYYEWAKPFIYELDKYSPNVVHRVIAELEKRGIVKMTYTQNIDLLHQRAGSVKIGELHGSPEIHTCLKCGKKFAYPEICSKVLKNEVPHCDSCGGLVKPNIVFYGESLDENLLISAEMNLRKSDLLLVLGSSLTVNPAAMLPRIVLESGGKIVIVNRQPTPLDRFAELKFDDLKEVFEGLENKLKNDSGTAR